MKLIMPHDPFALDPISSVSELRRDMSRLFDFSFPSFGKLYRGLSQSAFGGVDLYRDGEKFVLRAELPGVARESITVDVVDGTLVLAVNGVSHEPETTEKPEGEAQTEQAAPEPETRFSRSFSLPAEVDTERIDARYENGVLVVELPQREKPKPRAITVDLS